LGGGWKKQTPSLKKSFSCQLDNLHKPGTCRKKVSQGKKWGNVQRKTRTLSASVSDKCKVGLGGKSGERNGAEGGGGKVLLG